MERLIGNAAIMLFPKSKRELNESAINTFAFDDGKPTGYAQWLFSDENKGAFVNAIDPKLKQTGIFIDRFFFGKSCEEVAEKYGVPKKSATALYINAKKRLVKTIEAMDRAKIARDNGEPLVKMTKMVRVFLLHAVFGLTNGEISRLLDVHHTIVHRYINNIKDRIITGEVNLLDYTDEGFRAAKARLEAGEKIKKARLPQGMRVFLLSEVVGLSYGEIQKLFGITKSAVSIHVSKIRDQIIAGELNLIDYTNDEFKKAQERIGNRKEVQERFREKKRGKLESD